MIVINIVKNLIFRNKYVLCSCEFLVFINWNFLLKLIWKKYKFVFRNIGKFNYFSLNIISEL